MKIVFFAGGPGTRFWPISRKSMPKQLIPMFDGKSTMKMHLDNMFPKYGWNNIFITTTETLATRIKQEFPELPLMNLITEPERRDLGPAVGLTMMKLSRMGAGKEPVAILWTDNFIGKPDNFFQSMMAGERFILQDPDKIIFIGEKPQFPNENLGWIEIGDKIDTIEGQSIHGRQEFVYRPKKELAEAWVNDGKHLWNTGYFITTPDFILGEYERQNKGMYEQLVEIGKAMHTGKENEVMQKIYPQMESISFDNVVLEGLSPKHTLVLAGDFGWSDPGTLYALKQFLQKDPQDNVTKGNVYPYKSEDCLLYNYNNDQLLSTIGLEGFVVVNTKDAILVTHKDNIRLIGDMLKEFDASGLDRYL